MSINFKPRSVPSGAGVYIFKRVRTPLYIGKAANLKRRLASYFKKNASDKVTRLRREATKLEWIETEFEIEALIKEAELIKKYQPKWNYLLRDDKNHFYIGVTQERFPRIFVTHQLTHYSSSGAKRSREDSNKISSRLRSNNRFIGPFTSGLALKETLRLLRRIFPYCTCGKPHKRPCLNSQIGRCPGYCCLKQHPDILKDVRVLLREYRANVKNIIAVLTGRKRKISQNLKREMRLASSKREFEKAAKLRDQVWGLENLFRHRAVLETKRSGMDWSKIERALQAILKTVREISRVEGYDISNISGTEATGSMVVFVDGVPAKSDYRKFKIKNIRGANDVAMLKEVISRRLRHHEWKTPDLMLIDGGKAQLNAVKAAVGPRQAQALYSLSVVPLKTGFTIPLKTGFTIPLKTGFTIPLKAGRSRRVHRFQRSLLAALAKREEELYTINRKGAIPLRSLPEHAANFLKRVRDESHRFARGYHHKLRELSFKTG